MGSVEGASEDITVIESTLYVAKRLNCYKVFIGFGLKTESSIKSSSAKSILTTLASISSFVVISFKCDGMDD